MTINLNIFGMLMNTRFKAIWMELISLARSGVDALRVTLNFERRSQIISTVAEVIEVRNLC